MADIWALTVPATIGAVAWLYQKAWERLERRVKHYEEVIDALPGFLEGGLDPAKINTAIALSRRLWIHAPDRVVMAFNEFFSSVESGKGHEAHQLALGRLILEMRRDSSILAALAPRFRSKLQPIDFQLKSAKVTQT